MVPLHKLLHEPVWDLGKNCVGCPAGQEVISALIACLAACHKSHSADANLLASDALDVLHKVGHRLSLQELSPELPSALLRQLCQALDPHCSPLRTRITAAGKSSCALAGESQLEKGP